MSSSKKAFDFDTAHESVKKWKILPPPSVRRGSIRPICSRPIQRRRTHTRKVRGPKPRDRIPPLLRREPTRITPNRTPARNVRKRGAQPAIKPRVQEPQHRFPSREQRIIDERQHACGGRARSARPVKKNFCPVPDCHETLPLCGNIRVAAAGGVVQARELTAETADVRWYDWILIAGSREVVREAAAAGEAVTRVEGGDFGCEVLSSAYGGDVRAAVREGWQECRAVGPVVSEA